MPTDHSRRTNSSPALRALLVTKPTRLPARRRAAIAVDRPRDRLVADPDASVEVEQDVVVCRRRGVESSTVPLCSGRGSRLDREGDPRPGGRRAVVTGANSGLGILVATELARAGADVILGLPRPRTGGRRDRDDQDGLPGARIETRRLDLADLASVREFAGDLSGETRPRRPAGQQRRGDGAAEAASPPTASSCQLATNHLGHFALAGLLLDRLLAAPAGRVVTVSSLLHRIGRIDFDDLHGSPSLPSGAGLQPVEARQPAVRLRARPTGACGRQRPGEPCGTSGLRATPTFNRHRSDRCCESSWPPSTSSSRRAPPPAPCRSSAPPPQTFPADPTSDPTVRESAAATRAWCNPRRPRATR